jgi:hypothetical protein
MANYFTNFFLIVYLIMNNEVFSRYAQMMQIEKTNTGIIHSNAL